MLTNFFGKSKPINYALLSALLVIGFCIGVFKGQIPFGDTLEILWALSLLLLLIFGVLLLDFVIRKNTLTLKNTFGIFIFTLFLVQLPVIYSQPQVIGAMLFLMLATRRFLSLKSGKNIEKKIFDASAYITIAGLLYPWCWLFFIVMFLGIMWHTSPQLRYLIIPVSGVFLVLILKTTYHLLVDDSFEWLFNIRFSSVLDFSAYHKFGLLITVSLTMTFVIWMGVVRLIRIPKLPKKEKSSAWLILIALLTTIAIAVLGNSKTGAELLIPVFPLAIIAANYFEKNEGSGPVQPFDFWFKELLLWLLLVVTVFLLFI